MTREEQIRNKAKELGQAYFPDSANIWARSNVEATYVEYACVEMAKWLDQHPNWISVEDELPKVQDWYLCYNDVEDGSEVLHWEGDGNVWMDNDWHYKSKEITNWMPIVPPRKEANNE